MIFELDGTFIDLAKVKTIEKTNFNVGRNWITVDGFPYGFNSTEEMNEWFEKLAEAFKIANANDPELPVNPIKQIIQDDDINLLQDKVGELTDDIKEYKELIEWMAATGAICNEDKDSQLWIAEALENKGFGSGVNLFEALQNLKEQTTKGIEDERAKSSQGSPNQAAKEPGGNESEEADDTYFHPN